MAIRRMMIITAFYMPRCQLNVTRLRLLRRGPGRHRKAAQTSVWFTRYAAHVANNEEINRSQAGNGKMPSKEVAASLQASLICCLFFLHCDCLCCLFMKLNQRYQNVKETQFGKL